MRPRSVLYIVVLVLIAVLLLANWTLLASHTELNLLVARIQAPLGVLILLLLAAVILVNAIVQALSYQAWGRERRALAKEIEGLRLRAEREEESRMRSLRETMDRDLAAIRGQLEQVISSQSALAAQLSQQRPSRL